MKVKICGLTNKDDATWALNYGADYLGVNFYKESPRSISLATAQKWVPEMPGFASIVGVFVNAESADVVKAVKNLKLKGVQLHGDETADFVKDLKSKLVEEGLSCFIVKALRVGEESVLGQAEGFVPHVDYFLLDAKVNGEYGGTGQSFDWAKVEEIKNLGKPILLAGGLQPGNVKKAVKKVQPYAVDVASGVEKTPKKKDLDKLKEFITNAKG